MAWPAPLTICSVSFHSRPWLEINLDLALAAQSACRPDLGGCRELPGGFDLRLSRATRDFRSCRARHSSVALCVRQLSSRPGHEPDPSARDDPLRAVLRSGLLHREGRAGCSEVLEHMAAEGLACLRCALASALGLQAPLFPCVHCMFVDLERVPLDGSTSDRTTRRSLVTRDGPKPRIGHPGSNGSRPRIR